MSRDRPRKKQVQKRVPQTRRAKSKIKKVFREFEEGKLRSGSKKGPVVTSRAQATAIALSEARKRKKK